MRKLYLFLTLCILANTIHGQINYSEHWADSMSIIIEEDKSISLQGKLDYSDTIYSVYEQFEQKCKMLDVLIGKAGVLDELGFPDSALSCLIGVEKKYDSSCDSILLMELYANYTYVYLSMNELERNDSISKKALGIWNEDWEDKTSLLVVINNLSISKAYQGDLVSAESYFRLLLKKSQDYNFPKYEQRALINLGNVKGMQNDLDSAYYYNSEAAKVSKLSEDVSNHVISLLTLANIERIRNNYVKDELLLDSALHVAINSGNVDLISTVYSKKASSYANSSNYEDAYNSLQEHLTFKEQYLNEERVKAVAEMTGKYESEKQNRQIQDLKLTNLNSELETNRIERSRGRFIFAGVVILILALALWSRLRFIRKAHDEIKIEKEVSENLLLNILPEEVAIELKEKGFAEARNFDNATILFSDFKDFTVHSENMSPHELVGEIDVNFKHFDGIMSKYGIEKIKTIGDAYMAAGGLPDPKSCSPKDVVLAGLEMQKFVKERRSELESMGMPVFEMRVGIHTGTVIAGIVGIKKFQYDIWGDTVNTAARMESSSQVEQVNISESTYELIKDEPDLNFTFRGMIEAKGKGQMKMYFVELA